MSREGYTVPTGSPGGSFGAATLAAKPSAFNPDFRDDNAQMKYLCGDCGSSTHLRKADPIRCKDCGCRVLYKERTKRMIQFEAR
ncbi:DNA directed RNA polymerase [Diaporthe sp. PMI_573]|nr:DNA directed RNA polymerase [Diaporthaceae sp. PMI_573]